MKKRSQLLIWIGMISVIATSCVNENDTAIPAIKRLILKEDFETVKTASGSTEAVIALEGWQNFCVLGSRKWHGRTYNFNKYAEFSSFFSNVLIDPTDEIWLISPALDFSKTEKEAASFETKMRFWQGNALTVYVSEDYDGTPAGIATATWIKLSPILPTAAQADLPVSSGKMDVSQYNYNVRIAFKYTGSKKTGLTTTYQIDNINIFEDQ